MPNQHDHPVFHNFSHIFHRNIFSFISTPFLFEHGFPSGWMSQNIPISAGDRRRDEQELRSRPSWQGRGQRSQWISPQSKSSERCWWSQERREPLLFYLVLIYPFSFLPPSEKKDKERHRKEEPADRQCCEWSTFRESGRIKHSHRLKCRDWKKRRGRRIRKKQLITLVNYTKRRWECVSSLEWLNQVPGCQFGRMYSASSSYLAIGWTFTSA